MERIAVSFLDFAAVGGRAGSGFAATGLGDDMDSFLIAPSLRADGFAGAAPAFGFCAGAVPAGAASGCFFELASLPRGQAKSSARP
ncbi:MAG TPA: hypothetical protein VFX37_12590, partial [Pseudolabrys sp.]|nr:hypothetical protein [Pseudolabrys sp.]